VTLVTSDWQRASAEGATDISTTYRHQDGQGQWQSEQEESAEVDKYSTRSTAGHATGWWRYDVHWYTTWDGPGGHSDGGAYPATPTTGPAPAPNKPVRTSGHSAAPLVWNGSGLVKPIAAMSDAELAALLALTGGDDAQLSSDILSSLSEADWQALNARLAARRGPGPQSDQENPWIAGALAYGKGLLDFGLDLIPGVGQAKAGSELFSGKNLYGEEIGVSGRVVAGLSLIPGAAIIKKLASLGDAARGAAKAAGAADDLADAGRGLDDAAFEAPKVGETGTALVPRGGTISQSKKLGEWGETRLRMFLNSRGYKPTQPYMTSLGKRTPDYIVDGVAHESKAGVNVKLTEVIKNQILKDAELLREGEVKGVVWHFWQGADGSVLDFLNQHGIPYIIH
jgi:hypothetical protein